METNTESPAFTLGALAVIDLVRGTIAIGGANVVRDIENMLGEIEGTIYTPLQKALGIKNGVVTRGKQK